MRIITAPELRALLACSGWTRRVDITVRGRASSQDLLQTEVPCQIYVTLRSSFDGISVYHRVALGGTVTPEGKITRRRAQARRSRVGVEGARLAGELPGTPREFPDLPEAFELTGAVWRLADQQLEWARLLGPRSETEEGTLSLVRDPAVEYRFKGKVESSLYSRRYWDTKCCTLYHVENQGITRLHRLSGRRVHFTMWLSQSRPVLVLKKAVPPSSSFSLRVCHSQGEVRGFLGDAELANVLLRNVEVPA